MFYFKVKIYAPGVSLPQGKNSNMPDENKGQDGNDKK